MSAIVLLDPSDEALITVDWSDLVVGSLAIAAAVTHFVPAPLVKLSETTDVAGKRSQVKVAGAQHGALYQIEASVELNNGERLNRQFPVRAFNG